MTCKLRSTVNRAKRGRKAALNEEETERVRRLYCLGVHKTEILRRINSSRKAKLRSRTAIDAALKGMDSELSKRTLKLTRRTEQLLMSRPSGMSQSEYIEEALEFFEKARTL